MNEKVILTLGDGDFTFSLDMGRYYGSNSVSMPTRESPQSVKIIATGIDTIDELHRKYKDSAHTLHQLKSLAVSVQHGVNAICAAKPVEADVCIFNHPHLGTEDAARHSRFLHHFFHECQRSWLNDTGVLHLTLAKGQWERWKGAKAAAKHGFVIADRLDFSTPPVDKPRYQHRRHQTGKSFERRTVGSETFVMAKPGRIGEVLLPWQFKGKRCQEGGGASAEQLFCCPHCPKHFRQPRSLKNHIKCVHEGSGKKRKRESILCEQCRANGVERLFAHDQALRDHIQAKHSGGHDKILPDWAAKSKLNQERNGCREEIGHCEVCAFAYESEEDKRRHEREFLPDTTESPLVCKCAFCAKTFRDRRAQYQHENFCSARAEQMTAPEKRKQTPISM